MRSALLLAIASALTWGFGSVFMKRLSDTFSPTTFLVSQYLVGVVAVGGWIVLSGRAGTAVETVGRRWPGLLFAALILVVGYLLFIAAVKYAGEGSIPTAAAIAIASAYPPVVALLSAPLLGEQLGWNHIAAIGLVFGAVILAQL